MSSNIPSLLPGIQVDHVMSRLSASPGNEVGSGKILSPDSSAALAINCIGWFIDRPAKLPAFPGVDLGLPPVCVDIEFEARFPWHGGHHPWLDGVVITDTTLTGIESKRFEPYRDKKTASFSDAYDRDVWGERMQGFAKMRDTLRAGEMKYRWLDAAQLVKHGFGLVTEGRRRGLAPMLMYLYAEPAELHGKAIDPGVFVQHRAEVADFAARVVGCEVQFSSASYRDWIATWPQQDAELHAHGERVLNTFRP